MKVSWLFEESNMFGQVERYRGKRNPFLKRRFLVEESPWSSVGIVGAGYEMVVGHYSSKRTTLPHGPFYGVGISRFNPDIPLLQLTIEESTVEGKVERSNDAQLSVRPFT